MLLSIHPSLFLFSLFSSLFPFLFCFSLPRSQGFPRAFLSFSLSLSVSPDISRLSYLSSFSTAYQFQGSRVLISISLSLSLSVFLNLYTHLSHALSHSISFISTLSLSTAVSSCCCLSLYPYLSLLIFFLPPLLSLTSISISTAVSLCFCLPSSLSVSLSLSLSFHCSYLSPPYLTIAV